MIRNDQKDIKSKKIQYLENQIASLQIELEILRAEVAEDMDEAVPDPQVMVEAEPISPGNVDQTSSSEDKIDLFRSLFQGRPDVCAKRWKNKPGYSPYCANDFRQGICGKPKIRCSECEVSEFVPLGPAQVRDHLMGRQVFGLYPLTREDTCHLLAMDMDEAHWFEDAQVIRSVCRAAGIPVSLERSRSGNGGHLWWFFEEAVPAGLARKFGMALLDQAMAISASLTFASFDRLFPSQDILPRDGFGNLIALPLQKESRAQGNTVFLNEEGAVIEDQWAYLSGISRITTTQLESIGQSHGGPNETEEAAAGMPLRHIMVLHQSDFPPVLIIRREAGLRLSKKGMSAAAIHGLRRLASYGNPEFFARQAMRLSAYGIPRMTVVFEEDKDYLRLPGGIEVALLDLLIGAGVDYEILDERIQGKHLNISFN